MEGVVAENKALVLTAVKQQHKALVFTTVKHGHKACMLIAMKHGHKTSMLIPAQPQHQSTSAGPSQVPAAPVIYPGSEWVLREREPASGTNTEHTPSCIENEKFLSVPNTSTNDLSIKSCFLACGICIVKD